MAWLDRLDAAGHRFDAAWDSWLERHLSPLIESFFDWVLPLILAAIMIWGLTALPARLG